MLFFGYVFSGESISIKDFAMNTKPLRQLTCEGVKWQWTAIEQSSLERLQAALSTKTTLGYFHPSKPTTISVDGSSVGLGAVLTQMDESTKEVIPYIMQVAHLHLSKRDIHR